MKIRCVGLVIVLCGGYACGGSVATSPSTDSADVQSEEDGPEQLDGDARAAPDPMLEPPESGAGLDEAPDPDAGVEVAGPRNYLGALLDAETIERFFAIEPDAFITPQVVVDVLTTAGIEATDAERSATPGYVPTDARADALAQEFQRFATFYFDEELAESLDEARAEIRARVAAQGGGYSADQFLAYLRIGFGPGSCDDAPAGQPGCEVEVVDLQDALLKGIDVIPNLRYRSQRDSKFLNPFAVHREDIAYRLIFDHIARFFDGAADGNPLRSAVLDTSDPAGPDCQWLLERFRNGTTLTRYLEQELALPESLAATTGRLLDGVTEIATNEVTGLVRSYQYGLFYFQEGNNCSRLDARDTCYAGDPALIDFLVNARGLTEPREDGNYTWSCPEIGELIAFTVRNPSVADASSLDEPYLALDGATTEDYQFPNYWTVPQSIELTGEDVLMFVVALSNGQINQPGAAFADNIPVADIERLSEASLRNPELTNPEWAFQDPFIRRVFDELLLRRE